MPAAINEDLKVALDIDDPQMGVLYSVYSFPNMLMVILGGVLVDRFGLRMSTILCVSSPSLPL